MLERLVLKSPIQRTSQRVKRTSAARVIVRCDRWLARSFGRFAGSLARSLDRSVDRSIDRSFGRSVAHSVAHSVARSLSRPLARSFDRALDHSLDRLLSSTTILADRSFRGFEFRIIDMLKNDQGGKNKQCASKTSYNAPSKGFWTVFSLQNDAQRCSQSESEISNLVLLHLWISSAATISLKEVRQADLFEF